MRTWAWMILIPTMQSDDSGMEFDNQKNGEVAG